METTTGAPGETPSTTARRRLVVIIGPIASGKSTLASELAGLLRGGGQAVAVLAITFVAMSGRIRPWLRPQFDPPG